mmetsp:Transcript_49484/g.73604  ORF Transcript_49484/g.73604 Transcript_49484/m.73604 type:complete len:351 (-) Transcript_49484:53-1105(-)
MLLKPLLRFIFSVAFYVSITVRTSAFPCASLLLSRNLRLLSPPCYSSADNRQALNSRAFAATPDMSEFLISPLPETPRRIERIEKEEQNKARFLQGNDLIDSRASVVVMKENLKYAIAAKNNDKEIELTDMIEIAENSDAEEVYVKSLEAMQKAMSKGRHEDSALFEKEAMVARECIPQLNLHGLWVGRYRPTEKYDMINITYIGDTLVATKVTGADTDLAHEKGEIAFQVDLSPLRNAFAFGSSGKVLQPVELHVEAATAWGMKSAPRFRGVGKPSSQGTTRRGKDKEWLEGQLIMFGEYFSFAWPSLKYQVFFGRPTDEIVFDMMKNAGKLDNDRNHLEKVIKKGGPM